VDQNTLRHKSFDNIWSLGDVMNAPNAKTAAAARKQAPVVAQNLLTDMGRASGIAHYDGYGSCPLTVEKRQDRAGRVRLWRQAAAVASRTG
jgi:sulfide:quinone oxidoreductase